MLWRDLKHVASGISVPEWFMGNPGHRDCLPFLSIQVSNHCYALHDVSHSESQERRTVTLPERLIRCT